MSRYTFETTTHAVVEGEDDLSHLEAIRFLASAELMVPSFMADHLWEVEGPVRQLSRAEYIQLAHR